MLRKTKIVATIGPATNTLQMLERLIRAGVNVCRLNFSFGTYEEHAESIRRIRAVSKKLNKPVAILQDLQGPKIRIGKISAPLLLKRGETIALSGRGEQYAERVLPTSYRAIARDCKPGKTILLADGKIILKVTAIRPENDEVVCRVECGGTVLSGKGINLPYTDISLPAVTEKDEEDALFGAANGIDFIGMSFIRRPEDAQKLRNLLESNGYGALPIVAKIEKPEALDHLDAILDAVDGVMVARGDLAVELSFEKVPAAQKRILQRANQKGKLSIIATEMLSSMVDNPLPTRAEVSDVANGVWDGSDCVMLSNETAMGKYPREAVKAMAAIISETEAAHGVSNPFRQQQEFCGAPAKREDAEALCHFAAKLSSEIKAKGLIVITSSGATARMLAKYRPALPIYALCATEELCNRLSFHYNVYPLKMSEMENVSDDRINHILLERKIAKAGDQVICLRGSNILSKWALRGVSILTVSAPDK